MAGYQAVARDIGDSQADRARETVEKSIQRFVKAGKLSEEEAVATRERLTFTSDLDSALDGAGIVIEAVPEVLDLKRELWAEVKAKAPADALLGTNTSQLSITSIAGALAEAPPRLVGVHFFNPPVMMRLVELIAGLETDPAELERAREYGESL